MGAVQRVGGTVFFKIGGSQWSVKGKFEIMPLSTKKTGVVDSAGPVGYKEEPVLQGFKATLTDLGGVSVQQLQGLQGTDMTIELNNGKVYILVSGWLEGELTMDAIEGSYEAEFRGMAMNEQVAS